MWNSSETLLATWLVCNALDFFEQISPPHFFLIEMWLIYNVVLIQVHSDSVMHIYILFQIFFIISYCKIYSSLRY